MVKAIRIHAIGGPEVLRFEEVALPEPAAGQARVRHTAIGVNFIDTYHRTGLYPLPLPSGLGVEAAGVVEAVGTGVAHVKPGDRVAYVSRPPGAYAEAAVVPADRLVLVPPGVPDEVAAAAMLKGMTVWMLIRKIHAVSPGETVLFHAAAGGVGLIAMQWLRALGARTIATVGSDAKGELARAAGASEIVVYTREDFVARVRALTGGAGVPVVYDSVGRSTFAGSLDCLAPRGLLVSYGNASGPVPPFDVGQLAAKGSLFLTRPTLFTYTARREDLEEGARELFAVIASGQVRVDVKHRWPLERAADAHRALEGRQTTGSIVLLPRG
ncbi:MAG TPA: quinone oxidoreductase [Anaeromyxobacteraceae bacterium]|nr:quinone oxidoreductase [Anaeromyxobacteraceae bacterium]